MADGTWAEGPAPPLLPIFHIHLLGVEYKVRESSHERAVQEFLTRHQPSAPAEITVQKHGRVTIRTFGITEIPQQKVYKIKKA